MLWSLTHTHGHMLAHKHTSWFTSIVLESLVNILSMKMTLLVKSFLYYFVLQQLKSFGSFSHTEFVHNHNYLTLSIQLPIYIGFRNLPSHHATSKYLVSWVGVHLCLPIRYYWLPPYGSPYFDSWTGRTRSATTRCCFIFLFSKRRSDLWMRSDYQWKQLCKLLFSCMNFRYSDHYFDEQ